MSVFCKIGLHHYLPAKAFGHWYIGVVCFCGKRKLIANWRGIDWASVTEKQASYDWLNEKPQQARVLRMIK